MFKVRLTRSVSGYADFSAYEITANKVTASEGTRKIPEKWLVAFADEFEDLMRRYGHVSSQRKTAGAEFEKGIMRKGLVFTKLLFGGLDATEGMFSASMVDPIVFSVDREYGHLPFEILSDGNVFLCDLRPVLRSMRIENANPQKHSTRPWLRRSKLFLPIAATDTPDVMRSAIAERDQLIRLVQRRRRILKVQAPDVVQLRLSTLLENMLTADFMHFAGHSSEFEIPLAGGEFLVPDDITKLKLQNLDLVFLNSCQSAKQSRRESHETFATAFIAAGARHFIGYGLPVSNGASEIVSLAFWKNIHDGDLPHEALFKARQALQRQSQFAPYRFLLQEFGNIEIEQEKTTKTKYSMIAFAVFALCLVPIFWWQQSSHKKKEEHTAFAGENMKQERSLDTNKIRRAARKKKRIKDSPALPAQNARLLIDAFVPISMKHSFSDAEVKLIDDLFYHIAAEVDTTDLICKTNVLNGEKANGKSPIVRRQIIHNLLVAQCLPEAPADWNSYVQNKLYGKDMGKRTHPPYAYPDISRTAMMECQNKSDDEKVRCNERVRDRLARDREFEEFTQK